MEEKRILSNFYKRAKNKTFIVIGNLFPTKDKKMRMRNTWKIKKTHVLKVRTREINEKHEHTCHVQLIKHIISQKC